eukprot:scaffold912_cov153-Amphora_coffeaeformis.AAC.5
MSSSTPPPSNWGLRFSFFLRAIGLKRGFRRTGPSTWLNLFVAAGVGAISGKSDGSLEDHHCDSFVTTFLKIHWKNTGEKKGPNIGASKQKAGHPHRTGR